jgi:hypothetical protein
MSRAKYGLLQGLGQGMSQAGAFGMQVTEDKRKQKWQEEFANKMQEKQWARDDTVRAGEQEFQKGLITDSQAYQDRVREEQNNRADTQLAADQNRWEQEFGLRENLFNLQTEQGQRQMDLLDQQIKIGELGLKDQQEMRALRSSIDEATDPGERESLIAKYVGRISDFKPYEPITITAYGPEDPDTGLQTRTTLQWDRDTNKWTPVMGEGQQTERPSLESIIGGGGGNNNYNPDGSFGGGTQTPPVTPPRRQVPDGFTLEPSVIDRVAPAVSGLLSYPQSSYAQSAKGRELAEHRQNEVVQKVQELLQNNMVPRSVEDARIALNSGQLTPEQEQVLRRYIGSQ